MKGEKPTRTEGEPHDEMTRLGAVMLDALAADPARGDTKAIIFLSSREHGRDATVLDGFEEDGEAMATILVHLQRVFEANGKTLQIHALREG
jgi:hypothetical protein